MCEQKWTTKEVRKIGHCVAFQKKFCITHLRFVLYMSTYLKKKTFSALFCESLFGFVSAVGGRGTRYFLLNATEFVQFALLPSLSIQARLSFRIHHLCAVTTREPYVNSKMFTHQFFLQRRQVTSNLIGSRLLTKFAMGTKINSKIKLFP